jgi:short chain dehydrogenase
MDLGLQGKVALITGASKGIGLSVTKALVEEGVRVVAGARDIGGELTALAEAGAVRPVAVDLSTVEGPQQLLAETDQYGRPRHPGQQRRRGDAAARWFPERDRRPVAGVAEPLKVAPPRQASARLSDALAYGRETEAGSLA